MYVFQISLFIPAFFNLKTSYIDVLDYILYRPHLINAKLQEIGIHGVSMSCGEFVIM